MIETMKDLAFLLIIFMWLGGLNVAMYYSVKEIFK